MGCAFLEVAATGTYHDFSKCVIDESISDISSFSDTLHPDRKIIHENKHLIQDHVASVISEYLLTSNKFTQATVAKQKNYFDLNIVEFYNDHNSHLSVKRSPWSTYRRF